MWHPAFGTNFFAEKFTSVNAIAAYDGIKAGKVKAIVVDKEGMALKALVITVERKQLTSK